MFESECERRDRSTEANGEVIGPSALAAGRKVFEHWMENWDYLSGGRANRCGC